MHRPLLCLCAFAAIAFQFALAGCSRCSGGSAPGGTAKREAQRIADAGAGDAGGRSEVSLTMVRWKAPVDDPSAEQLAFWQKAFDQMATLAWRPLPAVGSLPDGARVELESRRWSAKFLRPAFDPWRTASAVERMAHDATTDTPDTLRSRFVVQADSGLGQPPFEYVVSVTETTYCLRVDVAQKGVEVLQLSGDDRRAAYIGDLAERALNMRGTFFGGMGQSVPYEWVFQHGRLDEGAHFSTSPGTDAMQMMLWTARVDGGIQHGHVYFMGFKVWVAGPIVTLAPAHWFDGKCWEPYQHL